MEAYPQFYRKGSICIVREGDTYGEQIEIPEPRRVINLIHTRITLPSKNRFDEMISDMENVTQEVYEKYISAFYRIKRKRPKQFRENGIRLLEVEVQSQLRHSA